MKKFLPLYFVFFVLNLSGQVLNHAYRLPDTPDKPAWAKPLYGGEAGINFFETDAAFHAWEAELKIQQKAARLKEREAWEDLGENAEFEENIWEEYYKRWRHAVRPFVQEDGSLNFEQEKSFPTTVQANAEGINAANWSLFGPIRTYWAKNDISTQPPAPWQANVYAIDVAPSDANVLYYGTETGAVGKSIDKGLNWTPLGTNYTGFNGGVGAVAIHPTDPNTVYVGNGRGIHKTTDGGLNWVADLNVTGLGVNDIKIKPDEPEVVLMAGNSLRRRNGSGVWSTIIANTTYDLAFKPDNSSIVYALVRNPSLDLCEFWKSTDGGQSFSLQSSGWISGLTDGGGRMTVTPADNNVVYAVVLTGSGPRVLKSTDAGVNWTITAIGETTAFPMDNCQGYYDLSIVASTSNANHIIVATCTAYKSTDGGVNYSAIGGYSGSFGIHPDIQEMKALGGDTWIATDGGINYSNDFYTSTANFTPRINGLTGTHFWGFDVGWNEDVVVGGRYHNGNTAWHENFPTGDYLRMGGGEQATGYVNPGNNRMVYFSDLGGRILPAAFNQNFTTFSVSKWPNEAFTNMEWSEQEWDPRFYNTYYIGNANILWKTTDNGATFTAKFTHVDAAAKVLHIEVSRSNPDVIYCTVQRSSSGELWKSVDGGANWTQTGNPSGPSASQRRISTVAVSGTDANTLWWCFRTGSNGNKIFKSVDGGASWTNITTSALDNVSLADMVHQLGTNGGIYLFGSSGKVFYKNETLNNWTDYTAGLPTHLNSEIVRAKIFYKGQKLRMASVNGIWQSDLYEPSATLVQPMADRGNPLCARDTLQLESYSVVNGNATYAWNISPAPQWISATNIRNPRVSLGNEGTYTVTLTVTDDNGTSTRTIEGFFNLPAGSGCNPDTLPGQALRLETTAQYGLMPALGVTTNNLTLSCWIKPNGTQASGAGVIFSGSGGACGLNYYNGSNRLGYHWNDNAGTYNWSGGPVVQTDVWTHVALVITPTAATIYLNGVPYTRSGTYTHPAVTFSTDFRIGRDRSNTARTFKGSMDEVCIYNKAMSQAEIRELMHLTRIPANDNTLLSYYQFNLTSSESGDILIDRSKSHHGSIVGNTPPQTGRIVSTGPFAGGFSSRLNVSAGGDYTFPGSNLTLTFPASGTYPNGELVAYRLHTAPDEKPVPTTIANNWYWIVRNYGTTPFSALSGMKFGSLPGLTSADEAAPALFTLYKRGSNDDGPTWSGALDNADIVTANGNGTGSITFSTGLTITDFSQFVIGDNRPALPLELLDFQAKALSNSILVQWKTQLEKNVAHFDVQRSVDGQRFEFLSRTIANNLNKPSDYTFEDKNVQAGQLYYYRLHMVDQDGNGRYSDVRVAQLPGKGKVRVFPVPAQRKETVTVQCSWAGACTFNLYTLDGKLVLQESFEREMKISLRDLPGGTYTYKVNNTQNTALSEAGVLILE
ncbi:MAG: T9SS type A sorting domain-containing protein [Chitinophagales bacterium]|nr:T9SS type A sorting domain-containing protein [Chitinophagales bacterium]